MRGKNSTQLDPSTLEKIDRLLSLAYSISESADKSAFLSAKVDSELSLWAERQNATKTFARISTQIFDLLRETRVELKSSLNRYSYLGDSIGLLRTLEDFCLFLDTTDRSVVPELISTSTWQPHISNIARKVLSIGDIAIDSGGSHGYLANQAAKLVGSHGSVIAFEEKDNIRGLIESSFRKNGFIDRVAMHPSKCSMLDNLLQDTSDIRLIFVNKELSAHDLTDNAISVIRRSPNLVMLLQQDEAAGGEDAIERLAAEGFHFHAIGSNGEIAPATETSFRGKDLLGVRQPLASLYLEPV